MRFKMGKVNWFNKDVKDVEKKLNTDINNGLSTEEVEKRKQEYGLNELKARKKK